MGKCQLKMRNWAGLVTGILCHLDDKSDMLCQDVYTNNSRHTILIIWLYNCDLARGSSCNKVRSQERFHLLVINEPSRAPTQIRNANFVTKHNWESEKKVFEINSIKYFIHVQTKQDPMVLWCDRCFDRLQYF